MRVLKTIVATAVVVFALTTVAMAGAQHIPKQSAQANGSQAHRAQPTHTALLTAAHQARQTTHHIEAAHHHTRSHHAGDATYPGARRSGGTHRHEAHHDGGSQGAATGSHHAGTSHHSGDHGDGGGSCGD
jgi:hypothetical protein